MVDPTNLLELPVSLAGMEEAAQQAADMISRLTTQMKKEAHLVTDRYTVVPNFSYNAQNQVNSEIRATSNLAHNRFNASSMHLSTIPVSGEVWGEVLVEYSAAIATPMKIQSYGSSTNITFVVLDTPSMRRYLERLMRKVDRLRLPVTISLDTNPWAALTTAGIPAISGTVLPPRGVLDAFSAMARRRGLTEPVRMLKVKVDLDPAYDRGTRFVLTSFARLMLKLPDMIKVRDTLTSRYMTEDMVQGLYEEDTLSETPLAA